MKNTRDRSDNWKNCWENNYPQKFKRRGKSQRAFGLSFQDLVDEYTARILGEDLTKGCNSRIHPLDYSCTMHQSCMNYCRGEKSFLPRTLRCIQSIDCKAKTTVSLLCGTSFKQKPKLFTKVCTNASVTNILILKLS